MPTFAFSCNAAFPNEISPVLLLTIFAPSDTIPNSSAGDVPVIFLLFVKVSPLAVAVV